MSDGSDDLKKNRLQNSPDARAAARATRAFAATLEPVWAALDDAAGAMEVSPGIATAGGAEASARSRHLGLHNALLGGVDVKSILPVVEARFALAEALARAERDAEAASGPTRRRGGGADASRARTRRPSMRLRALTGLQAARVVGGIGFERRCAKRTVHVTGAPTPGGSRADDERFAFGLARVASPAFGLAGALPGARGAAQSRAGPPREGRFARPTPRSRARGTSPTRTGRW